MRFKISKENLGGNLQTGVYEQTCIGHLSLRIQCHVTLLKVGMVCFGKISHCYLISFTKMEHTVIFLITGENCRGSNLIGNQ